MDLKEIREMDINLVFLRGKGAVLADSRILMDDGDGH